MAYQHGHYPFHMSQTQPERVIYHPQIQYPGFHSQIGQPELPYNPYTGFHDYADDMHTGIYYPEFEDNNDNTTRPRLTKDQVDILEHEFQKNPKPNSMLKRHLAATTSLNLPRVANWFQNRRAKAKQQRKQEEFEQQQSKDPKHRPSGQPANEDDEDDDEDDENMKQEEEDPRTIAAHSRTTAAVTRSHVMASPPRSPRGELLNADVRDRAHASLQRAIAAAQAAQYNTSFLPTTAVEQIPEVGSGFPTQVAASSLGSAPQVSQPLMQHDWNQQHVLENSWPCSPATAGDMVFDFGFDKQEPLVLANTARLPSPADSSSHALLSPHAWDSDASTPTMPSISQSHFQQPLPSPGMQMTSYVGARRGSAANTSTTNVEGLCLTTENPQMSFQSSESVSSGASDSGLDLASRRRRPRPAALTSAALIPGTIRSRSYGALTATSPTFRQGITPPSGHMLRHSKSTGHCLNSHYPGIRKSSIPQRSPLNFSTFAESEAFQELMAQKAAEEAAQHQLTPMNATQMSYGRPQEPMVRSLSQMVHGNASVDLLAQPQHAHVHSPPVTPFQPEFYLQTSSVMPPSVQAQYANFADYTPPYSAGPMTNSSWSDAPLTSPDLANFPPVSIIPSLPYGPSDDQRMPWMFSADQSPSFAVNSPAEQKKMEFLATEFPDQKEEHARVARLLDHPKPKHYVFEHKGQQDFSPS